MYLGINAFYPIRKKVAEIILPPEIGFLPPDPPAKISMIFTLLGKKVAAIILPPEIEFLPPDPADLFLNLMLQESCGNCICRRYRRK